MNIKKLFQKRDIDMLHGSLTDKILLFVIPLALSSILQQLFNSADIAVVGRFVGSDALAAVGANGPVINLLVNLFVGLSIGANVVISTYLGKNNETAVKKSVHTALVLAVISGLLLLVIGICLAEPILRIMATPESIMKLAVRYLRIIFIGMPFMMLYNFESSIFRSKGDTTKPLITLCISGIINVCLNLLFVAEFHMNVEGVALATTISNAISSLILLYFLIHEADAFQVRFRALRLDLPVLKRIAKVGVPAGLQGMVFSISNVIIQFALNGLGSNAVAGSAASLNYEYLISFLCVAFGQAGVTFIGQNYGAGNLERCRKIVCYCWGLGAVFIFSLCAVMFVFAKPLAGIFTQDSEVLELAVQRMQIILIFELLHMTIEVLSGCMRGLGYSLIPALISVIGICGTRIVWIYTIIAATPSYIRLLLVYPVSWSITTVAVVTAYCFVCHKMLKEQKA